MHMAAPGLGCRKVLLLGDHFSPSFVQMGLQIKCKSHLVEALFLYRKAVSGLKDCWLQMSLFRLAASALQVSQKFQQNYGALKVYLVYTKPKNE